MLADPGAVFRALHRPGDPFILANAWDAGTAKLLEALGAEAIGTSSSAHAFTLGREDMGHVTRDEALSHAADLVAAVAVPVSGDLENGYGDAPEDVAGTVRLAAEAGLAGLSIEDIAHPTGAAYDRTLAVERIRAAVAAARALPSDMVVSARADGVMLGLYGLEEGIARLQAFAEAGADCVMTPGTTTLEEAAQIVAAVPCPVNIIASGPNARFPREAWAGAGVARISLGSGLSRITQRLLGEAAEAMFQDGDFAHLA